MTYRLPRFSRAEQFRRKVDLITAALTLLFTLLAFAGAFYGAAQNDRDLMAGLGFAGCLLAAVSMASGWIVKEWHRGR